MALVKKLWAFAFFVEMCSLVTVAQQPAGKKDGVMQKTLDSVTIVISWNTFVRKINALQAEHTWYYNDKKNSTKAQKNKRK
ncbi:MAG TPA: hypothetical protein VFN95_04515 [Flavitalea sp.]|nr:hypothetical protein [Flavitalea sp.]